jgi:hypothetical protein
MDAGLSDPAHHDTGIRKPGDNGYQSIVRDLRLYDLRDPSGVVVGQNFSM